MDKSKVTIFNAVPAIFDLLLDVLHFQKRSCSIEKVLLSGDWIWPDLIYQSNQILPATQLIALGGATEASIWSIFYEVDKSEPSKVYYGKALSNQTVNIINEEGMPCPSWVIGEIAIGGKGLAKGYIFDEVKTKNSFVVDPLGNRIYRTGDLGRLLPSGDIEILGRKDRQVKINGYRIELGDIETAALRIKSVKLAQAILFDSNSKLWIGLAIVLRDSNNKSEDLFMHELSSYLPSYMLPKKIIFIEKFELTSNGKISTEKLKKEFSKKIRHRKFLSPIEMDDKLIIKITKLWKQVLNVKKLDVDTNFFDVGGDSLLAIQLISRIMEIPSTDIDASQLFENPTIRNMAAILSDKNSAQKYIK